MLAPEDFDADLDAAERAPDDGARFKRARLGYVDDVLEELQWTDMAEDAAFDEFDDGPGADDWEYAAAAETNPLRAVGRNDPCPCGSGKKFKKCCLM